VIPCAIAIALCAGATFQVAEASTARTWSASRTEEFSKGTLDGTALDEEGRVVLAPSLETLWGPEEGIVWDIASASDGSAFIALSGPGRLVRLSASGDAETWYQAEEDEELVTAVELDGDGGAYIGVSPGGRVIHVRGPGQAQLLETGSAFVWSLARDADGRLWIGTGVPGALFHERPNGNVESVYETGDDPVRCLQPAKDGGVVLGTGGRGRVIRVTENGEPFVLFDAEEDEIVDIAIVGDDVFALASGSPKQISGQRPGSEQTRATPNNSVTVTARPPHSSEERGEEDTKPPPPASTQRPPQTFQTSAGGKLYRISADGGVRQVWDSTTDVPFALVVTNDDRLLIATGDSGRLYLLGPEGRAARLLRIASNQASALAALPDGGVLVGGTTNARVDRLGVGARTDGSYLSDVIDAGGSAEWGRLRWDADLPDGSSVGVEVRSGNSAEPDETWSPWSEIRSPRGKSETETELRPTRWAQLRLSLAGKKGNSPRVRSVELFYLPRNRAPETRLLKIEKAGVVWVKGPAQSSNRFGPFVADDPVARKTAAEFQRRAGNTAIRKSYELGARTFSWDAADPDNDRLSYSLEIRQEGSRHWFPLANDLEDKFFSWDARGMPDGSYRAKIIVSDARDNPEGKELIDERVSEVFAIDNTRPSVRKLDLARQDGAVRVEFQALDPGGSVAAVEVAVDGGAWVPLDPLDGVSDSEEEQYELLVGPPAHADESARSVMVRVTDAVGNLGGEMWLLEDDH
jgi:sugar lactone lactonase YvrE